MKEGNRALKEMCLQKITRFDWTPWPGLNVQNFTRSAIRKGTMKKVIALNELGRIIGEHHPRAKLLDSEIDLVHELRESGFTLAQIGEKMGMSKEGVWKIVHGHRRGQTASRYVHVLVEEPVAPCPSPDSTELK